MGFLPKDYELPNSGNGYMKLGKNENKVRILSDSVQGQEWWVTTPDGDSKPRRVKSDAKIPMGEIERDGDPKEFWAFVVWNYTEERVMVLELTQRGVMSSIISHYRDDDWGDPKGYDMNIEGNGKDGMERRYEVRATPPKKITTEIAKAYEATTIDLNQLYSTKENPYGGNPFEAMEPKESKGIPVTKGKKTPEELLEEMDADGNVKDDLPL